ncbi:MAG: MFS transporter [Holophagaceae bacterium]|nr:MFS transporter [Holophagaceae bacterium]
MANETTKSPLKEITQPFIDLMRAPRTLWALNLVYLIEGFAYFGTLYYLAMFFNEYVHLNDVHAGWMVGVMTSGITFSMLFFGSRVDAWGLRRTLFTALGLMLLGRIILSISPSLGLGTFSLFINSGLDLVSPLDFSNIGSSSFLTLFSPLNLTAVAGILLVVMGFGMYQPAIYAGTRMVTTVATSGMAFAMLYAVNNLGGWLPTFMSPVRNAFGIQGALGFYAIVTVLGLTCLATLLTKKTLEKTLAEKKEAESSTASRTEKSEEAHSEDNHQPHGIARFRQWLKKHPLADPKFSFFIFCLIPVQTLFAYSWFIMPQYVARAYAGGWVGENFETATSLNSLLIFILCPIVAAISTKAKVYNMMIFGTAIMASSAFLLSVGPTITGLFAYILVLSIGEAMWQPRFLQYAAEIAPPGRTGAYMGVAQFPWFLTKMIVPLYSGIALSKWCPPHGATSTGTMWLTFGFVAILSPILLISAKGWVGKDFKTAAT